MTRRYWRKRQGRRTSDPVVRQQKWIEEPAPVMDRRLMRGGAQWGARSTAMAVFKAKLWWDHLPSQQVRARGTARTPAETEGLTCDLCGERSEGSTWHVLAECLGAHPVREARVLGAERLRAKILTILSEAQEATVCRMWLDKFTCREACWRCPAGWEDGGAKAGERENNW